VPHSKPVFHDPQGKRWKFFTRAGVIIMLLTSLIGAVLAITVVFAKFAQPNSLIAETHAFAIKRLMKSEFMQIAIATRERKRLYQHIEEEHKRLDNQPNSKKNSVNSTVVGFYVNWEPNSYESLRDHIDALSYVMPEWLGITTDNQGYTSFFSPQTHDPDVIKLANEHHVPIVPILNNIDSQGFQWKPLKALLSSPIRQQALINKMHDYLLSNHFAGINIDFEAPYDQIPDADLPAARKLIHEELPKFVELLKKSFTADNLLVTQDLMAVDPSTDYERLANANDFIIVMIYDQHVPSGDPGPIASQVWVEQVVEKLLANVDSSKVVLGLANYCYNWPVNIDAKGNCTPAGKGQKMLMGAALSLAKEAGSKIVMDEDDLNPYFTYADDSGQDHLVYLLDATTLYNQLTALRDYHTLGAALWYMGSEDPTIWSFFNKEKLVSKYNPALLRLVDFKNSYNLDSISDGNELMKVAALPTPGERNLTLDSDGLIIKEDYLKFPLPYILRQFGPSGKVIALTFDDGPDPKYTPQILTVLRHYKVHGTFFMVGENATQHPGIVKELWDDGNEIGNHTFTHPHISLISSLRLEFELNATERILESITGHRTLLFRPPFGEMPDISGITVLHTPQILQLQQDGYITVGMNIDPKDYESPSTDEILDRIDQQLKNNHIILLHDGGGNRENTVKALPSIITHLREEGYEFLTVSELIDHYHGAGKQNRKARADLFPFATKKELEAAGFDRFVFTSIFLLSYTVTFIFLLAIFLGVFRILLFTFLAVKQRRRLTRLPSVASYHPSVTVIIPAYNEGAVVCNTVQSVLESDYPELSILVVDDGSTDDTYAKLQEKYSSHPQVRLIHKENGGKSTALNLGLESAQSEIIVCMDADTIFLPSTIRNLVRQFIDPKVGAVAGNVKVGNRINMLTIWQSIEYITNQNFDRLAFAALNSVPVIPGAVGAWRRDVIQEAGGFEDNTLAEDTDLTFKIRCLGYYTCCDNDAIAYTEAPDSVKQLAKQRFRWSFGILQALWKHRHKLYRKKYGAFGSFVMPSMWVYNIFLQAIAPLVDLSVLYLLITGDFMQVVFYLSVFFVLDLLAAFIAMRFDNEKSRQLVWLFWQRFFYREFMYFVILKSLFTAMRGGLVGWGNLQRRATVSMPGDSKR